MPPARRIEQVDLFSAAPAPTPAVSRSATPKGEDPAVPRLKRFTDGYRVWNPMIRAYVGDATRTAFADQGQASELMRAIYAEMAAAGVGPKRVIAKAAAMRSSGPDLFGAVVAPRSTGEQVGFKFNGRPAKGAPTQTNVYAMMEHFAGRKTAPTRMPPTDLPHLKRPMRGHLFSLGVFARAVPGVYPEHLRAVAVVSLPRSQALMLQGAVVEVVRVAVASGLPPLAGVDPRHRGSEASFVLRHVVEAAVALGYDRVVSSTLLGEAGAGYRGAGWRPVAVSLGGEWSREGREREAAEQPGVKVRWEAGPGASEPVSLPDAGTVDELVRDAHALALADPDAMPLGGPREAPARRPRAQVGATPSLPKMNRPAPPWKPAQGPRRGVPSLW